MLHAERTEPIAATLKELWALIADPEGYPEWHPFFSEVAVLERDADERVVIAKCRHETSVVVLHTELSFRYDEGTSVHAEGTGRDLKSMAGSFVLEKGAGDTALTHTLDVDPGMKLGLLLRGPVEDRVRRGVLDGAFRGIREKVG